MLTHVDIVRLPGVLGLGVALGVYGLGVFGYIAIAYWRSPEYQAAQHYEAAWELLGPDRDVSVPKEELDLAYTELLEAARLMPQVKELHEQLEQLNWRYEGRRLRQPTELRRRAEAVAMTWRRIQDERQPILVVGARDRGWSPEQLKNGPLRTLAYSSLGVLAIVLVWLYGCFNARRMQQRTRQETIDRAARDIEELRRQYPSR
ncbi:MAG: hypothetical protein ACOZIN_15125 [Myxococcota bacterium]